MKKRFAALFLSFSIILSLVQISAFATDVCMKLDKTKAISGEIVTLIYTVPQQVDDVGAVSLKINFDKDKLTVKQINGATVSGATTNQAKVENSNSNGEFSVTLNGVGGETFTLPAGTVLLTVTMEVKDGVNGNASFTVEEISLSDAIGAEIETTGVDSTGATLEIVAEIVDEQTVSVEAPVKNGTPQGSITADTKYTGAITWEGNPSKFAANTVYTANITLTAAQYYRFAQAVTVKVEGATISETKVAADGSTLTFKATFPKTEDRVLNSIAVTTPPTKTSYQYGDTLDMAGMVVTGTYDDGTTGTVTGCTVEYANNGTYFALNDTSVTIKKGDKTATLTGLTVGKKAITVKADNKSKTYGEGNPELTFTVPNGALVGQDTKDALGVALTCTATASSPAGTPVAITGTANGANYEVTVTPGALTINKATIVGITSTAADKSLLANDTTNNAGLDALTAYMALPAKATVTFGEGKTEQLDVTWTADKAFQQKGAVYTFTGKVAVGTNFNTTDKTVTTKLTVTPVKITAIGTVPATLTLSKAQVTAEDATLASLGLPGQVTLTYDNGVTAQQVNATFDKDLAAIQVVATQVTDAADKKVELTLTANNFPAWATLDATLPKTTVTITNKYVIPESAINFENMTATYGGEYTPSATVTPDGEKYEGVTCSYTYAKDGKTIAKPVDAGTYTVTVTVENDNYKGSKSVTLTISPKTIDGVAVTLPEGFAAVYNKAEHKPVVAVKDGDTVLVLDKDYTVAYANNTNAGTATITVTGKGNYDNTTTATKTFEIAKAPLAEMKPTVVGTAAAGNVLTAKLADVAAGEYTWSWTVGGTGAGTGSTYTVLPTDSNKAITVTAVAAENGNYTGSTLASEALVVAKVAITGTVTVTETNVTDGEEGKIEISDILTAAAAVIPNGVGLSYQWYNNGTAIEEAIEAAYTVAEGDTTLTVTVTPDSEDYTGSITSTAIEVGKATLTGTVTLSLTDGMITAAITDTPEGEGIYDIVWLRDGTVIAGQSETTYTVTAADKGHSILAKIVAKGETYTGEVVAAAPVAVATTVPGAPTVTVSAGNAQVTVRWTAPADNGGSPITGYQVQMNSEAAISLTPDITSYTFTGLTNGTAYSFTVKASNAQGDSEPSEGKTATPTAPVPPTPPIISGGGTVTQPKVEITTPAGSNTVNVTVPTTKDKDGGYTASISDADAKKLVETAGKVEGGNVEIVPTVDKDAQKVTVTLPASAVSGVAESKTGSAVVKTPVADVELDNNAIKALGEAAKESVGITAEKKDDEVKITVTADGKVQDSVAGSITARLPVEKDASQGTVAVLVKDDGTEEVIRTSVVANGKLVTPLEGSATVKITDNHKEFVDTVGHWAESSVDFVSARDLFLGIAPNEFGPANQMTRGMLATVLFRLDGEHVSDVTNLFTDVANNTWYTEGIQWASAKGIVKGNGDGTFTPENPVTREQICAMLYRYAEELGLDLEPSAELSGRFADADQISGWAVESVRWAVGVGLVGGRDTGLAPQDTASRAEVATMLQRFVEFMAK